MLRAISHDLRTPLTSISGNARAHSPRMDSRILFSNGSRGISVESKEEILLAKMDAKLIVQVIINIVDNAIQYTPKNSHIVIRTEKRGKQAIVSISDDGNGIADEIKPRIFDMFYSGANQIADSRRSLGLGLSLCKSIINAHGGELTVSDNLPHGTVFTFTLPAGEVKVYE